MGAALPIANTIDALGRPRQTWIDQTGTFGLLNEILHGDCLTWLRSLPDESVHCIVTDPPSGISFMGEEWDSDKGGRDRWIAWLTEIMEECFRVLKPGGHVIVWALPRTSHWTRFAIEDAGFRIQHIIDHIYATGFPKSLNISKQIDKMRIEDTPDIYRVTAAIRIAMELKGMTTSQIDAHFGKSGMAGHWTTDKSQPHVPKPDQWDELRVLLAPFLDDADLGDLVDRLNGRKGKPSEAFEQREVVSIYVKNDTRVTRPGFDSETYNDGRAPVKREIAITKPTRTEAEKAEGWGTALKPAHEDWILAMKPLKERNYACQFMETGTGGLNIDACRVRMSSKDAEVIRNMGGFAKPGKEHNQGPAAYLGHMPTMEPVVHEGGRWPTDLLFTHAPGCRLVGTRRVKAAGSDVSGDEPSESALFGGTGRPEFKAHGNGDGTEDIESWSCEDGCPVRLLDTQSGYSKTPKKVTRGKGGQHGSYHPIGEQRDVPCYGDEGTAGRFFPQFAHPEAESSMLAEWGGEEAAALFSPNSKASLNDDEGNGQVNELGGVNETLRVGVVKKLLNPGEAGGAMTGPLPCCSDLEKSESDFMVAENQDPFIYSPKPAKKERNAGMSAGEKNDHPTLKGVRLMSWLVKLIAPPGAVVVDPFCGSGTTGFACVALGFHFIGMDQSEHNADIARKRNQYALQHPEFFRKLAGV